MTKVTVGGNRLGSGKKMKVNLKNFERSTHDLGYTWRSTISPGTIVPFMNMVGLPGDTFDIKLDTTVLTLPTIGPLLGSFKLQFDIFLAPVRLYQAKLHNNMLGIGNDMTQVKLPQIRLETKNVDINSNVPIAIQQVHPSSLLAYLGIRGIGRTYGNPNVIIEKTKNAIPTLAYWDIYKNFFANKQEGIGMYINALSDGVDITAMTKNGEPLTPPTSMHANDLITLDGYGMTLDNVIMTLRKQGTTIDEELTLNEVRQKTQSAMFWSEDPQGGEIVIEIEVSSKLAEYSLEKISGSQTQLSPNISQFDLDNLDNMRMDILAAIKQTAPFEITKNTYAPYGTMIALDNKGYCKMRHPQQGLALKTYQSDIFNNWIDTEWIDGENGISAVTAMDVSDGLLHVDQFYLAKKVYDMLNRIAISGGSYYDWIEAAWSEDAYRNAETPMYMGGKAEEIIFDQVVSNSESETMEGIQPLGTLGGRGTLLGGAGRGGNITVKVSEPSYIMGVVSITPRIDYSQGNEWDTRLRTMDDFHKPSMDGIGFMDGITETMAWWDTLGENDAEEVLKTYGKLPAWTHYMTNYDRAYGNFAVENSQMFMTLNRNYSFNHTTGIGDLTTYVDPTKYNYAFAQTDISAMNFMVQIGSKITARRKMSAKQIPNL